VTGVRAGAVSAFVAALVGGTASPAVAVSADGWPSLNGTSGLVLTPTAEVLPDASMTFGYVFIDRNWAHYGRGEVDNELYFISFGFLPRVELSVRATVLPGTRLSDRGDAPIVDRMGGVRLLLLRENRWPSVAVGIDDVRGTRFFHSLYGVGTKGFELKNTPLDLRFSLGYGSRALEARRHVLDGVFGGVEARLHRTVSVTVDFDTEKWNSGVRLKLFRRLNVQVAWLNLATLSGGVSWTQHF
jgi:hypothetical protein